MTNVSREEDSKFGPNRIHSLLNLAFDSHEIEITLFPACSRSKFGLKGIYSLVNLAFDPHGSSLNFKTLKSCLVNHHVYVRPDLTKYQVGQKLYYNYNCNSLDCINGYLEGGWGVGLI